MPRAEIERPPPRPDIKVHVYLNRADHERIQQLALDQKIPGAGRDGAVSAFFRHLERVILEDWT
tara:strand:+ start:460 stop:651 length:192 start_codon:yes stop_codon:yes gene_type:complete